jgi:light-regulated signal transduction histidine kinase (bacteriophytochrome)
MIECKVRETVDRRRPGDDVNLLKAEVLARVEELEGDNQELEAFVYTVAHDLYQPLSLIKGYLEVIETEFGNQLPEKCKDHFRQTYQSALRMKDLIMALLSFSRLGHLKPDRKRVDLATLASEVVAGLKLADPERRVDFQIPEEIIANCEPALLTVVMQNIIGNAWKYTRRRQKAVIELGVGDTAGVPTYFVRDNGIGFDMSDADKIFIPFHRLSGPENMGGFGIGLATVERIIRQHGGVVWAEGERDKGACISFTLQPPRGGRGRSDARPTTVPSSSS